MRNGLPSIRSVNDIRLGRDVSFDAWWYTFCAENNIEHSINPEAVASAEQLRFMAALDDDQVYVPCSDGLFRELVAASETGEPQQALARAYAGSWKLALSTIYALTKGKDPATRALRRRMILFCRHRLRTSLALGNILPARLVKRLISTIVNLNSHNDPWAEQKLHINAAMAAFIASDEWRQASLSMPPDVAEHADIGSLRHSLDVAELARLFLLAANARPGLPPACDSPDSVCDRARHIIPVLEKVFGTSETLTMGGLAPAKTVLFVGDSQAGVMADLPLLKALARQGHRIILSLKDGPLFFATTFWETRSDPSLAAAMGHIHHIADTSASKNELLHQLSLHRFVAINDGTSELLNLYRVSTTFARAWKECDVVIIKGRRQAEQILGSSTQFTRDILTFWQQNDGALNMHLRPKAEHVIRFSDEDLMEHADAIIETMRQARAEGKTVIFYSCIIGSLPGETSTAIRIANEFAQHLRERLDQVLIINPAEHFAEGMDADDLMFMWERVQRSGFIQTWRFQTADDIETSFALMELKVPPVWAGKDATFSTGCTKEMRIALDMQRIHPEMQILGPSVDKFFRRGEYGVGKFYDAVLKS